MRRNRRAGIDTLEIQGDEGAPTIVLFHGFGANAEDLASLSEIYQRHPKPTWIFPNGILEIPFSADYVGRAWFPINMQALQDALYHGNADPIDVAFPSEFTHLRLQIEEFLADLSLPRSKLILGGFSQGAVLAVETALHFHERCAALILLSGTLINEANWRTCAPLHAHTPFFQSHGDADPILPISGAQRLEKLLLEGGLIGKLHTFHGGHTIPQTTLTALTHFLKTHV